MTDKGMNLSDSISIEGHLLSGYMSLAMFVLVFLIFLIDIIAHRTKKNKITKPKDGQMPEILVLFAIGISIVLAALRINYIINIGHDMHYF